MYRHYIEEVLLTASIRPIFFWLSSEGNFDLVACLFWLLPVCILSKWMLSSIWQKYTSVIKYIWYFRQHGPHMYLGFLFKKQIKPPSLCLRPRVFFVHFSLE